jgi:hypothetical protein
MSDREALGDLYSNADIFVHPNPREPFGIAPLEAMASGLALVAPNSGGVTSYASRDNAWLADATGPSFAQAVRSVHADEALRQRKIEAARLTAERHSWDAATETFLKLYDDLYAFTKGLRLECVDEWAVAAKQLAYGGAMVLPADPLFVPARVVENDKRFGTFTEPLQQFAEPRRSRVRSVGGEIAHRVACLFDIKIVHTEMQKGASERNGLFDGYGRVAAFFEHL